MKTIRKTFILTEKQEEMMEMIRDKHGLKSFAGVFDRILAESYKDDFKDYIITRGSPRTPLDPKDLARLQLELKDEKAKVEVEARANKKVDICENMFHGKVIENGSGLKICRFPVYSTKPEKDSEDQIPLSQISEDLRHMMFAFDEAQILKLRPDLKKIFNN